MDRSVYHATQTAHANLLFLSLYAMPQGASSHPLLQFPASKTLQMPQLQGITPVHLHLGAHDTSMLRPGHPQRVLGAPVPGTTAVAEVALCIVAKPICDS